MKLKIFSRLSPKAKRLIKFYTLKVLGLMILIAFAITTLFPYIYMVSNSFKSTTEIVQNSFTFYFIPKEFTFSNYAKIFEIIPLHKGFINTFIVETLVLLVGTSTTCVAAFAFSRVKFAGRKVIFYILLSGMMVPFVAVLVPQYNAYQKLNLFDTLWPLIIPGLFGNVGMLFFMKQYADTIPTEIYEAAEIDGAGFFQIFMRIFLPLVKTAILVQVIFWFLGIWNDFFGPDIYLPSLDNKTLQVMIRYFSADASGGGGGTLKYQPYVMAASVLSSIPTIIVYVCFQKYFVNTFVSAGIKG